MDYRTVADQKEFTVSEEKRRNKKRENKKKPEGRRGESWVKTEKQNRWVLRGKIRGIACRGVFKRTEMLRRRKQGDLLEKKMNQLDQIVPRGAEKGCGWWDARTVDGDSKHQKKREKGNG